MDIRVNGPSNIFNINSTSRTRKTEKTKSTNASSSAIEVSSSFKEYQVAKMAANSTDDVREDKVAELKSRYESGNYQVNVEDLANKIMMGV